MKVYILLHYYKKYIKGNTIVEFEKESSDDAEQTADDYSNVELK